jgi:hypothetical protein
MIKTVVIPKKAELNITIPEDYIGKLVEVILYAADEVKEPGDQTTISTLRGKLNLTEEQYSDFNNYLSNSRNEWNRDI